MFSDRQAAQGGGVCPPDALGGALAPLSARAPAPMRPLLGGDRAADVTGALATPPTFALATTKRFDPARRHQYPHVS
jgi:hypothetical protein